MKCFHDEIEEYKEESRRLNREMNLRWGILASLSVEQSVLNRAEKQGLLVLGVGDELMEVKNSAGFVPKR